MKTVLRAIAGIVVGVAIAFALVVAVELFSSVVHPLPEDFDGSQEEMCQHVERYPAWVLAVVVPIWAFTAFAGVWTAQRIGVPASAALVGSLLIAAVAFNVWMLPYPIWFKIAELITVPAATIVGARLARRKSD